MLLTTFNTAIGQSTRRTFIPERRIIVYSLSFVNDSMMTKENKKQNDKLTWRYHHRTPRNLLCLQVSSLLVFVDERSVVTSLLPF